MTNCLQRDDCLHALDGISAASVQLIYLDPPFNTQRRRKTRTSTYEDAFGSAADYIDYMRPRVEHLHRILAPHGSLFFHCDWRTSHHVRVMLDQVFGVESPSQPPIRTSKKHVAGVFVNEIIWHYGLGASQMRRQLLTKHDMIFWYASGPKFTFNLIRDEPTEAMLAKYRHTDQNGNRFMLSYGKRYLFKGGKPLDDVWDIPAIAPTSGERVGYPTQKPLALLQRIIRLASNAGETVLDPFCGSGTTLVAAKHLGRNWIGIDANPQAIKLAETRLAQDG